MSDARSRPPGLGNGLAPELVRQHARAPDLACCRTFQEPIPRAGARAALVVASASGPTVVAALRRGRRVWSR